MLFSVNLTGFAQSLNSNIISISQAGNSITVIFNLPKYSIKDTSLLESYGVSEIFKYIEVENFGIIDDIGYPQLPQLSIALSVPKGATNFEVTTSNMQTYTETINREILPMQEDLKESSDFQINNNYYNSNGSQYNFTYQLSEPYIVFSENGIDFSIFPFTYNPQSKRIEVLKQGKFTITFSNATSAQKQIDYTSSIKETYLSNFFENYSGGGEKSGSDFSGRYLIITAPGYESTITYFANYKRNIGYSVNVVTTNTTGTSNSSIKNYIQTQYNNTSTRPDFVLLVGDQNHIPASGGSISYDIDDPITDLEYARLAGDDYFADVFLGRFSVSNTTELQNIINKTIYMEMNLSRFAKKAKFIAGDEDDSFMRNQFERGHDNVIDDVFNPQAYNCQKLYQPNITSVVNALSDNPLFYLYSGHGSQTSWGGGTFNLFSSNINSATNTVFPFVFAFACHTGNFAHSSTCIGEQWIRLANKGAVAYFGSSVSTYTNSDVAIETRIFGDAFVGNERIGEIIGLGMKDYWQRFWSFMNRKRTKRYMKAYNLLGDPSLNMFGTGCIDNLIFANNETFNSGDVITYRASNTTQNNASFEVKSGAQVQLTAGNSITLKPGFKVEPGANFSAKIEPCNENVMKMTKSFNGEGDEENIETSFTELNNNEEIFDPRIFSFFPNPTNSDFSVSYTINEESFVKIELYDMLGNKIKTLLDIQRQSAGNYYSHFSMSELSAGIYLLVFSNNSQTITDKIIKN